LLRLLLRDVEDADDDGLVRVREHHRDRALVLLPPLCRGKDGRRQRAGCDEHPDDDRQTSVPRWIHSHGPFLSVRPLTSKRAAEMALLPETTKTGTARP